MKSLKDNLNFKDCNVMHEDARGVFFRDYMWFLSDEDGTIEKASGAGAEFPKSRALIFNGRRNFTVHVNDGDHIRITCMTHFGDLLDNYKKTNMMLKFIKEHPNIGDFNKHKNFGYVN